MKIEYSKHIKRRLELRGIEYELPRIIFEQAEKRYLDRETGHMIAVTKVDLYDKNRDVMVAYVTEADCVKLLTIHPLKKGQKENRVNTGRCDGRLQSILR